MEPNKLYHVYTHANGFENLFKSQENYRYFLQRYQYFIPTVAETLAWCLMPNHLHLLIKIKSEEEIRKAFPKTFEVVNARLQNLEGLGPIEKRISKQFSNLFNAYTKAFNIRYKRRGTLFIPNFKRKEITDNNYLSTIICYIHMNPVHHGFVSDLQDWSWSSYHDLLSNNMSLIHTNFVINWFGNEAAFQQAHQRPGKILPEDRIENQDLEGLKEY